MIMNGKIMSVQGLASILNKIREDGKKIIYCHGCFDLLHIGHIRYFEQAKAMGDVLVVTVTPDCYVDKGPHRPAFTESLRVEAIASLGCVDFAAINQWPTAEETLRLLRPHVYVKGSEFRDTASDMTGKIGGEVEVVQEIGAQMAFTDDIVFSSTKLINQHLSGFSEEVQEYLNLFRQRYTVENVFEVIDEMASLRVLIIGDTILDDYTYCEAIGKSSKEPILALKHLSSDIFAGGVLSVANHAGNFADQVDLITTLGQQDSHEEFILSQLSKNVRAHFSYQPNAPTLIKRRFLDGYSFNKLFEIYVMGDSELSPEIEAESCHWLRENLNRFDVVIAADFGHGAISDAMVEILVEHAPFLAINTQANAGNRGFHTISRYPRAHYVCIAEPEMRLEMRRITGDLRPMMEAAISRLGCGKMIVTRGRKGCLAISGSGEFLGVPSFANKVIDRIGAGDAFFSVTALAAFLDVSSEMLAFIGNVVGALAVEILGNQKSIDKLALKKYILSLLK